MKQSHLVPRFEQPDARAACCALVVNSHHHPFGIPPKNGPRTLTKGDNQTNIEGGTICETAGLNS